MSDEPNEQEEPGLEPQKAEEEQEPPVESGVDAATDVELQEGEAQEAQDGADGVEIEVEPAAPPVATSALSRAIAALQQGRAKDRDRLLRTAAEFDNYKKRSRRDARDGARRAEERVVLEFLPVVDNLERAFDHTQSDPESLLEGVRMVIKQFLATLEKYEIKPFDSLGQAFSPECHEAVQQMPSEHPASAVCQQLQKGYMRGDHLVRPALVIVSTGPAEAAPPDEQVPPPEESPDSPPDDAPDPPPEEAQEDKGES
jgi:molecular chaperone GrpE